MRERMTTDLAMQVPVCAISSRRPKPGLIQHTDCGSQYCAQAYQKLVRQFGMRASISRRGNPRGSNLCGLLSRAN
jgi:putative transposase